MDVSSLYTNIDHQEGIDAFETALETRASQSVPTSVLCDLIMATLTLSYLGGADSAPLMFFFHHPETAQAMKLKLSDFKDTCLRHILQVIPGCYILRCYHANKVTKGTLQNLTQ